MKPMLLRSDTCQLENLEHIVSGPRSIDPNTVVVTGMEPLSHKVHILSTLYEGGLELLLKRCAGVVRSQM